MHSLFPHSLLDYGKGRSGFLSPLLQRINMGPAFILQSIYTTPTSKKFQVDINVIIPLNWITSGLFILTELEKKMGINLFRGEQKRECQANKKLLCPFQMSFCVFSSSFLGGRYGEYLVLGFLMEGAAKVEKILSEEKYLTGVLLSWNSCESEQENVWFPSERSLGEWGLWLSMSLLGSKLLAFWSWCDDSVHSRLLASSPLNLVFAYSNCCRLQHFGFFHILGVVFQRTWRCSKEVPLPLITKTN